MSLIVRKIYGSWYRQANRGMEGDVIVRDLPNVVESVQFMDGNTLLLLKHHIAIGRHSDSNIIIDSLKVSRHHCMIAKHMLGHWYIRDLNSSNGTYVKRGEFVFPVHELKTDVELRASDIICLAQPDEPERLELQIG